MTTPTTYRKKPVTIQAMQYDGTNADEVQEWTGRQDFSELDPEDRIEDPDQTAELWVDANGRWVGIEPGEWIIQDSKGFYPCKPDIFQETYEEVTA